MAEWKKGEITYLTNNYGKKTIGVIAEHLGRSEAAVGMYLAKHRKNFKKLRPTVMGPVLSKRAKKTTPKKTVAKKFTTKRVAIQKTTSTPKAAPVAEQM
jgi:hypothetical protein